MRKHSREQSEDKRRKSNPVAIGGVYIGADHPVAVQSMLNTSTLDTDGCVEQIERLIEAGCRIVRLALPTHRDAENIPNIINALRKKGILMSRGTRVIRELEGAEAGSRWIGMREELEGKKEVGVGCACAEERTNRSEASGKGEGLGKGLGEGLDSGKDKDGDLDRSEKDDNSGGKECCTAVESGSTPDKNGDLNRSERDDNSGCKESRTAVESGSTPDKDGDLDRSERDDNSGCKESRTTVESGSTPDKPREREVALVADVHFNPELAMMAALYVDKVRINPGNYSDPDGAKFIALLDRCRERGVALRIGVNHGSLSSHIVEQWGDTPRGMVESAMEFLRVCQRVAFDQVVVSIKASNVRIMVQAYRELVARMEAEQMHYPLHLGVTEAGSGIESRVKSAAGIGALLVDGIGDTIRVSLTEPPENEIPVAQSIVEYIERSEVRFRPPTKGNEPLPRRSSLPVGNIGGEGIPLLYGELNQEAMAGIESSAVVVLRADSKNPSVEWRTGIEAMDAQGDRRPVIIQRKYSDDLSPEQLQIAAAIDFAAPLIDALVDGIWIESPLPVEELGLAIFQATRTRMSTTELIACPGCARTLFDLEGTLVDVKSHLSHLRGLKIAIMGCIVNGPGEMSDADYGYVGEGAGRVTLYRNREVVVRSIPQNEAIEALIQLIKGDGRWIEREGVEL